MSEGEQLAGQQLSGHYMAGVDPLAAPVAKEAEPGGITRTFAALQNPTFVAYWIGILASFVAMQMQQVARGFLAYDLTGSATALGVVMVSWGLPLLLLSPVAGVVTDWVSKRSLLVITMAVMGLTTLVNAILISLGVIQIWHLVVLGVVQGVVFAFSMPVRQAIVPELVGLHHMPNAIALNNAGMNMARIVGPAVAGVLIGVSFVGLAGVFYLMAGCYVAASLLLLRLPSSAPGVRRGQRGSMGSHFLAGVQYLRQQPALIALLCMAFVPVIFAMPYQALMPAYVAEVLKHGPESLGALMGANGVGALIGSLFVAYHSNSERKTALQLVAGVAFGIGLVMFALSHTLSAALAFMLLVGMAGSGYMAINNTLILANTEPAMYGRVMSVYVMTFSLMPISALPMGALADAISVPLTLAIGGGVVAASTLAVAALYPKYRTLG
ncbi:MAG: MFS transporter [Chloroflexi bacterium]|nr:MFS transporter [Chloroflexota bacterium]